RSGGARGRAARIHRRRPLPGSVQGRAARSAAQAAAGHHPPQREGAPPRRRGDRAGAPRTVPGARPMTTPADDPNASSSPPTWSVGMLARSLAITCVSVGLGAGVGYLISHEPPPHAPVQPVSTGSAQAPPPRPPPAGSAELSLLAPLKEGGALDGFDVAEIDAVDASGQLRLVCRKGSAEVKLTVALQGEGGPEPPATAGHYAVFYGTRG